MHPSYVADYVSGAPHAAVFWSDGRAQHDHVYVPPVVATKTCSVTPFPSRQSVWVVPAWLCAAGYVKDPCPRRSCTAQLSQLYGPVSAASQLTLPELGCVCPKRYIIAGEKILAHYGAAVVQCCSSWCLVLRATCVRAVCSTLWIKCKRLCDARIDTAGRYYRTSASSSD